MEPEDLGQAGPPYYQQGSPSQMLSEAPPPDSNSESGSESRRLKNTAAVSLTGLSKPGWRCLRASADSDARAAEGRPEDPLARSPNVTPSVAAFKAPATGPGGPTWARPVQGRLRLGQPRLSMRERTPDTAEH